MLSVTFFVHICSRLWQPIPGTKPCISSKNPVTANTSTLCLPYRAPGSFTIKTWGSRIVFKLLTPEQLWAMSHTSCQRVIFLTYANFFPSYLAVPDMKPRAELHIETLSLSLCNPGGVLEVSLWSLICYSHLLSPCSPAGCLPCDPAHVGSVSSSRVS